MKQSRIFGLNVIIFILVVTCKTEETDSLQEQGIMARIGDSMFGNFQNVSMSKVFEEIQSKKVVSYTIARDTSEVIIHIQIKYTKQKKLRNPFQLN